MSNNVVFPVLYATLRLHLDKGRQWSVVEHLLLYALCQKSCSIAELVEEGNLPRRLIIEAVIRLMRVGWVELVSQKDHYEFRATSAGVNVVSSDVLPAVTRPTIRYASFAIDKVSGTVFRSWDLSHYTRYRLDRVMEGTKYTMLDESVNLEENIPAPDEIIGTLLDDDEYFRGIDSIAARWVDRYAVVSVHGDTIDGLPTRAPAVLRERIRMAANVQQVEFAEQSREVEFGTSGRIPKTHLISFDVRDFVLGGDAHRSTLENVFNRAQSRILVHSTFVSAGRFRQLLPLLSQAAHRGAQIDILWGKTTDRDGSNSTAVAIEECREMLVDDFLRKRIRLHRFSTDSHAKIIVADDGRGKLISIIGSCNWLSTGFESFDASVVLSDPGLVAEVFGHLSAMTIGRSGYWSNLTKDLSRYAVNLRRGRGSENARFEATIVLGAEHNGYIRRARDDAEKRIFLGSHRLGGSAETGVLVPARAAVNRRDVDVTIFYGRHSGPVSSGVASGMERDAGNEGVRLQRVHRPRLHGKFLVWDDDHAVVTSQNWLSADPSDNSPYAEIGVYISGPKVGSVLAERACRALAQDDEYSVGRHALSDRSES